MDVFLSVWNVHMNAGVLKGQKRGSDYLTLELHGTEEGVRSPDAGVTQVVASCLPWTLGTNLGSSTRAGHAFSP